MRKLLVATIGFTERYPLRAIISTGITAGDKILLITAEPIENQTRDAISKIEEFKRNYIEKDAGKVKLEVLTVDPLQVADAVLKIKQKILLESENYDKIVVNLSGGMRALIIETLMAVLLLKKEAQIFIELENFKGVIELNNNELKNLLGKEITGLEREILELLVKEDLRLADIVKKLAKPKSTIYKALKKLEKYGIVIRVAKSGGIYYKTTRLAKILL